MRSYRLATGLVVALATPLFVSACPSSPSRGGRPVAGPAPDVLRPVEARPPARPSREELVRRALAGTVSGREDALDARMQVRKLRVPEVPRGASARFDFEGGRRGWVTALPSQELLTSPAFAGGRIFVGGGFSSHTFYALAAYSGELDWAMAAPDGGPSAAIIEDDAVIFNTESCTLFVADAATGRLRWKRWLGDPLMSQPAAADGLVFSAYPASGGHELGAFRVTDGEPVWKIAIPADAIQAPQIAGDSVWLSTMDGTVLRVRRRDGHEMWRRALGASSAPWVDGDAVLVARRTGAAGHPKEQSVVLDAATGRVSREGDETPAPYFSGQSRDRALASSTAGAWGSVGPASHLGLENVASGWAFQGSSPAVADGRAYFALGGSIRAVDMATGHSVWTRDYRPADGAQAISPPAVVGSQIVFGTVDGHLYAADIDTGMTLWAYDVGQPIVFQPIVAQGWVYVATRQGNVIGLEVGDPLFDGWHMWGGNARHAGLVETAGTIDPALLASLARPSQGTMRLASIEEPAAAAGATPRVQEDPEGAGEGEGDGTVQAARRAEMPDLPLAHTTVRARVSGFAARITVTQQFQNPYERPIEAVYLMPLPADAAVGDMEMHIGERVVRARIQKKAEARRTYEQARSEGRRAALLEQQRPNLFAQRVANIAPGERIDVQIQYDQMLPFENGQWELAFPMVAPRRFDPAHPSPLAPAPDPLAPAAGQAPAVAAAPPEVRSSREIDLAVELDAGLPIERIASATHTVDVERRGATAARIALAAGDRVPNRDFVLRWAVSGDVPRATVTTERDAESGHLSLVVMPPAAPADATIAPRDVVFVVDTSSSMNGRPMEHARAVVRETLARLRPGDTVDLVAFSDRVVRLSDQPQPASPETTRRATEWIEAIRPVGATQMVPAIEAALARPARTGRVPIVVLVTDGFIGNEADVLRSIAERLGDARLYGVGVGSSVNRFLLERAAEVGRGRAVVVTLSEEPAAAATRFASWIDRPVFTDVEIDWGGLDVRDVYPTYLPDLFADKPLLVHARFGRGGSGTVRVRGTVAGRRYERVVAVALPAAPTGQAGTAQRTLWARAAIHDRLARMTLRDDDALAAEVTDLGLRYRIVTPYTSFVAVDVEPRPGTGPNAATPEAARPTLSPARSLPGDPEIRIPAPRDALAVTVMLPFGETVTAAWEDAIEMWSARFLIPADATDGTYPVEVLITHRGGRQERLRLFYLVDSSAPLVTIEVPESVRAGTELVVRARQVLTEQDLAQAGLRRGDGRLTPMRVQLLTDVRRVEMRAPDGAVAELAQREPGVWEGTVAIPADARGRLELPVTVVDLAANHRQQRVSLEIAP